MQVINKDILKANENIICHQVNPYEMGAGLARQIRISYPKSHQDYKLFIDRIGRKDVLGRTCISTVSKDRYIAHLFGQDSYGRKGQYTVYSALGNCLQDVRDYAKQYNLSIAIPYGIGCGLGGGDWNTVLTMITDIFENSGVVVNLYKI